MVHVVSKICDTKIADRIVLLLTDLRVANLGFSVGFFGLVSEGYASISIQRNTCKICFPMFSFPCHGCKRRFRLVGAYHCTFSALAPKHRPLSDAASRQPAIKKSTIIEPKIVKSVRRHPFENLNLRVAVFRLNASTYKVFADACKGW